MNRKATLTSSADADRARPQPQRADQQHGERAEAGQRLQHRVEQAAQPADPDQRVAQLARPAPRTGAVSSASRPIVLTTSAPSKLSCAIALTSARSCWARVMPRRHPARVDDVDAEQRREDGDADQREHPVGERTARPTAATSMTIVPTANGSGAIGYQRGLDVGVGVGQQRAGGVPLVPGQRQLQVAPGDPAPVARPAAGTA